MLRWGFMEDMSHASHIRYSANYHCIANTRNSCSNQAEARHQSQGPTPSRSALDASLSLWFCISHLATFPVGHSEGRPRQLDGNLPSFCIRRKRHRVISLGKHQTRPLTRCPGLWRKLPDTLGPTGIIPLSYQGCLGHLKRNP